jgi:hypothetical protein
MTNGGKFSSIPTRSFPAARYFAGTISGSEPVDDPGVADPPVAVPVDDDPADDDPADAVTDCDPGADELDAGAALDDGDPDDGFDEDGEDPCVVLEQATTTVASVPRTAATIAVPRRLTDRAAFTTSCSLRCGGNVIWRVR